MLAAVDVERSGRGMTPEDKLKHYVRTTMLFLEEDDSVNAERFLVKACLPVSLVYTIPEPVVI
jgi:hypothetical protein